MILRHKIIGTGKPLVILHGLFGSLDNWQTFAKSLADRYMVVTMDLRNHGLSPHTDAFNYTLMAEDVYDTLTALGLSKVSLMGHSMGGKLAAVCTIHYPEMIQELILLDISLKEYPPHHEIYFKGMFALPLDSLKSRQEADHILSGYVTDPVVRQFILKNLVRNEDGTFKWRFNLNALYMHYDQINVPVSSEQYIDKPVLFIRGGSSSYVADADMYDYHQFFPQARLMTIEAAGHWVHADKPEELKNLLTSWLG